MRVFLSWSGPASRALAEALRAWLPNVIQSLTPYMSSEDIGKGTRWSGDIAKELSQSAAGIICLTPDNLVAPWIMFEAGALSKSLDEVYVCPYLLGLNESSLKGPLVQFQATKAEKEDTRKLLLTINSALKEKSLALDKLNLAFEKWWPEFEVTLSKIDVAPGPESEDGDPVRSEREILEEVLEIVRSQERRAKTEETIPTLFRGRDRYFRRQMIEGSADPDEVPLDVKAYLDGLIGRQSTVEEYNELIGRHGRYPSINNIVQYMRDLNTREKERKERELREIEEENPG
jgi:hypothetical protein